MKKVFLFLLVSIISLSFLIFNSGIWAYVDTNSFFFYNLKWISLFQWLFSTLSNPVSILWASTTFGFDFSQRISGLYFTQWILTFLVIIFWQEWGFILNAFIYQLFWFISAYLFFTLFIDKKYAVYWALFYVFNYFMLWLIMQYTFFLSVPAFLLSVYAFYNILMKKSIKYHLIFLICILFITAYPRTLGLFVISYLIFFLVSLLHLYKLYLKNWKKLLLLFFILTIISLPFVFSIIFPYISWDKIYSDGLFWYSLNNGNSYNYFKGLWVAIFWLNTIPSSNLLQNKIWIFISSIFIILTIFLFLFKKKKNNIANILSIFLILLLWIKISPFLLSNDNFSLLTNKLIPFLSVEYRWIDILFVPLVAILISFTIFYLKWNKFENFYKLFFIIVIFINVSPFSFSNPKLNLIDYENIPKNYNDTFLSQEVKKQWSYFFPSEWYIYTKDLSYPIPFAYNSKYQEIFSSNSRYNNKKQIDLRNKINNFSDFEITNIENMLIFNLKNIFIFNDIIEPESDQFDYMTQNWYVEKSKEIKSIIKWNPNLYTKQDNENFAQFGLKNDDKYEYKIYSPAKIILSEIDTFFENKIDIKTKPLLVDSKSFQKIENIENFQIPKENQNIQISVKESVLNPTKHYIKLSNLDTSKPFLLQMNQTFGMSWKIKWVDKSYFDEKKCIDEYKSYEITDNSVCQYKSKLLELEDIRLLNKPEVNNKNHFEWNFVWNTWIVNPEDIPNEMKWEKELYAVIIYEKQIYYSYALIISWLTFLTLIILTIIQESRELIRRRKDKKWR